MDINDIRAKKQELRKSILKLLREFEAETNCTVTQCEIKSAQVVGMLAPSKVMDIEVKVEV
jgi:hypothetical protein